MPELEGLKPDLEPEVIETPEPETPEVETPEVETPETEKFLIDDPDNNLRVRDTDTAKAIMLNARRQIQTIIEEKRQLEQRLQQLEAPKPATVEKKAEVQNDLAELDALEQEAAALAKESENLDYSEYIRRSNAILQKQAKINRRLAERQDQVVESKLAKRDQEQTLRQTEERELKAQEENINALRKIAADNADFMFVPDDPNYWAYVCQDAAHPRNAQAQKAAEVFNLAKLKGLTIEQAFTLVDPDRAAKLRSKNKEPEKKQPERTTTVTARSSAAGGKTTKPMSITEALAQEMAIWNQ